jgi:hypothetical protein
MKFIQNLGEFRSSKFNFEILLFFPGRMSLKNKAYAKGVQIIDQLPHMAPWLGYKQVTIIFFLIYVENF